MEEKTNLIPISIEKTERILNQMKWSMVKINNQSGQGTGFFCHISINKKDMPILITNNSVINETTIKNNKEIKMTINDKEEKNIKLNKNRMIIISKKYNVTLIEIKPDEDNICYFLDLDINYLNKKSNFFNEAIYIIHYPKFQKEQYACVSYGLLKNKADSNDIVYSCNTNSGSSGSPILRLSNNKVIGIHHDGNNSVYTRNIFQEIIKEYLKKNENLKNSNNIFILDYKNEENDIRRSAGLEKEIEEIENNYKERKTILGPETTEKIQRKISHNITNSTILGPETSELEIGETPNEMPSEKSNNISNFFLDNNLIENRNLKEEIPIMRNSTKISSIALEQENQYKEKKANLSYSESQSVIKLGPEVEDEAENENNNINPNETKDDNNIKKDNYNLVEKHFNDINNKDKDNSDEDNFTNDELIKNQNKNTMSEVRNQKSKSYINKIINVNMNKNNYNKKNFNVNNINNNMNKINNNMNYINDNRSNLNNNMNNYNMNNNNMNNNNMNNNRININYNMKINNNMNNNMNNNNNINNNKNYSNVNYNNMNMNNNINNNMNKNINNNNNMMNINYKSNNINNNMNNNNMNNNNMTNNIDKNINKNNINSKSTINSKNNNIINFKANQFHYNNNFLNKKDYNNFTLINSNNNNVVNPFMSNINNNNNNDIHRYNNNIYNNFNNNPKNNFNNTNNLVNNNNNNNMNNNFNILNSNNFNNNKILTQRNNIENNMSNSMNSININKKENKIILNENKCDNNSKFNGMGILNNFNNLNNNDNKFINIMNNNMNNNRYNNMYNNNNTIETNNNSNYNNNSYNFMNSQKIYFNCNSEIKRNRSKIFFSNNNYNQGNNYEYNKQNNFNNINQINNNICQKNNNMNFINMLSNNSNEKTKASSFSNFSLLKVGIRDLEHNSYVNSILFLLLNIPSLTKFFLNKELHVAFDEKPLSSEFEQLFLYFYSNLDQNFKKSFDPKNFLNILKSNNVEQTPDKTIIYFFEILHKELNTLKDNTNIILEPKINDIESVKKCGIQNFVFFNNSIISNQLNLFEIVEFQCFICNSKIYNFLTNNHFKLDILGTYKKMKRRKITIKDCLQYQSIKKETKFCHNCKMLNPMKKISNLFSTSNLLLFILDRGNSENLDYLPFDLEEKIDFSNVIENQNSPSKYELFGVISATLKIDDYKYVCFCKSPIDKKWYYYDNEIIEETQIDLLINLNDGKQYIPLILLYKSL